MKQAFVIGAMIIGLTGAAQAESLGEKTGVNSALGMAPSTADFVREAAISDLFEIQSSQLARQKASGGVVSFADRMIQDHGKTSADLKSFVATGAVKADLPSALDASHQKKLDSLRNENGAEFAKDYSDDQVSGHKTAVDLFERYAKNGDNATLKQWASETLPTLKEHLQMAENLDNMKKDSSGRSAYDNPDKAEPK